MRNIITLANDIHQMPKKMHLMCLGRKYNMYIPSASIMARSSCNESKYELPPRYCKCFLMKPPDRH